MVTTVSPEKKEKIRQLLIQGETWDEITNKTGAGKSTIQKVFQELKDEHGQDIEDVIDTIKDLKKSGLSVNNVVAGARVYSVISKMEIDDEQFHRFASDVYKECAAIDLTPSKLVEISTSIIKLQSESKIDIEKLVPRIHELSEQKKDLEVDISTLEEKKKKAAQQTNEILAKAKLTESTLEEYRTTKEELESHGANFEQLGKLANMLKNSSGYDFTIQEIMPKLQKGETLEVQIQDLQEQNKAQETKLKSLQQNMAQAKQSYDITSKKLDESRIQYEHLENTIKIIGQLQKNGISPLNIIQWNNIIKTSNIPAYNLEKELIQYSGLKNAISDLEKNSDKLKNEEAGLESSIKTLTQQKQEIESSIQQTRETAIKTIEQTKLDAEQLMSSLQQEIKSSIESLQAESSKNITNTATTAQTGLQNIVASLDGTIAEISRYSESFGKLQSLRPLFEVMAGKVESSPLEIYLATGMYLGNFLKWLDPNKRSITICTKNLRQEITKEAKLLAGTR
ncbi:MAG: hypothetical protein ACYC6W_11355 [Nitrosotalea sp.]